MICTLCKKEFSFHRSTSSLKYHISAKHALVSASSSGACPGLLQTTLTENLTKIIAKWTAKDCRTINIVEVKGLAEVLQVASRDTFYKPPSRGTAIIKIHNLYKPEKNKKEEDLAVADYVALTGDHWT